MKLMMSIIKTSNLKNSCITVCFNIFGNFLSVKGLSGRQHVMSNLHALGFDVRRFVSRNDFTNRLQLIQIYRHLGEEVASVHHHPLRFGLALFLMFELVQKSLFFTFVS